MYQELHRKLDCLIQSDEYYESYCSDMKSSVISGQRAWIKTRNADSGFYSSAAFGGSIRNQWWWMEQKTLQLIELNNYSR